MILLDGCDFVRLWRIEIPKIMGIIPKHSSDKSPTSPPPNQQTPKKIPIFKKKFPNPLPIKK
jgi:hypothetical protein